MDVEKSNTEAQDTQIGAEMEPSRLTISQMSHMFNVSCRALRFYEERGLLSPIKKGNVRLYGPTDQARLKLILQGKAFGFTLIEIDEIIRAKRPDDKGHSCRNVAA